MSRLGAPLTTENIDDFFKIGKTVTIQTAPRSTLGGKTLDPKTGKAATFNQKPFVAPYKRHARLNNPNQMSYATYYQEKEREELIEAGQMDPNSLACDDDDASTITGGLERVESMSMTTGMTEHTAVILPEGKTEDEANEVYSNYNFHHRYDDTLSIYKHRQEILATIESNQTTVIQGATGSGKTTQVPQYILDHYAQQNRYCNIVVTQPRRIAAMSIARRICYERQWQLGQVCGYQVGMDRTASEDTRLLYCTTGVLLQKLIGQKHMQDFTHVILDEVHERDQESDFCLLVVKKLLHRNSRDVKVILMSATIDSDMFAQYFGVHVRRNLESAPVLLVEGRTYSVQEYYLENLKKLGELPVLDPSQPKIEPELYEIVKRLIMQFDNMEIQQYKKEHEGLSTKRGSVLIFLPGLLEINDLDDKLREIETSHKLWLLPLHSTITGEEQARVFDKPRHLQRKIIMSTNIAESSITVPDIKYVIDFCLTKNLMSDPETTYTSLQLQWASKANCTQRKGRAGRVSDGRVYRLVTRQFYDEHLTDYSIPEMQRCPLDIVVLKVKQLNLGEPKAILGLALSAPRLDDIEYTVLMLKEVGALASLESGACNPHDGKLTFVGRVLADLPLDIRLGKLILLGYVFGLLEECVIISASLSNKSFFSRPYKAYLEAYRKKFEWADDSFSDCMAYLNAFKQWTKLKDSGRFPSKNEEARWARDSFIQLRRINDVALLVREMLKRLVKFNIRLPRGPNIRPVEFHTQENQLILKVVLCGAFYPNYFTIGHLNEEEATKQLSGYNPHNTVMIRGLPANQGAVYRKEIEDIFQRCDSRNQKPKVHFEETKAFVEFDRDPTTDASGTKILPAVYMALKMRQLRFSMDIRMLHPEAVREHLQQLSLAQSSASESQRALRSNRFTISESANGDMAQAPQQVDMPPPGISTIQLCPTVVTDCGLFWAHYGDEDTVKKLTELQNNINLYQGRNLQPLQPIHRQVGSLCLAPFCENGQHDTFAFYRARIEKLKNDQQKAHVFFVDYGNVESVPYHNLKELESHFQNFPLQAFEVELCGIKPSSIKCPNGRWTKEAKAEFKALLGDAVDCFGQVYSIVNDIVRVDLFLEMANQRSGSLKVNQKLIDRCYADSAEESFLSKQNHRQREEDSLTSPPKRSTMLKMKDSPKAATMFNAPITTTNHTFTRKQGGKFSLIGPSSPYEAEFYNMTNVGRLRNCRIDRESVNCIALNDKPHITHAVMVVAASVSLNPSGAVMQARDTTFMPSIPGLPGLVSLLFAPTAELRADAQKKRYIGALCGLGWDPETGGPALGDHDMEVSFDTEFDIEDLSMINGVRMAINLAIGGEDTTADFGQETMAQIRDGARDKLLKLFRRRREIINTPESCPKPYQWNLVAEEDVCRPQMPDVMLNQSQNFLTLHSCIDLDLSDEDEDEEEDEEDEDYRRQQQQQQQAPPEANNRRQTPQQRRVIDEREVLLEQREHIQWLHQQASRQQQPRTITCNICNLVANDTRQLRLHLETRKHRSKEAAIMSQAP